MVDFDFGPDEPVDKTPKDELIDTLKSDLQTLHVRQRDIETKLQQSRGQVDQLAQRNAMVQAELQKIKAQIEQAPRMTIQETYDEALVTQQRLMTVRTETEKLSAQEEMTRTQVGLLENLIQALSVQESDDGGESFDAKETIVKIIDAQEEERESLARKMHDGPAHSLTNFILQAEIVQKLFDRDADKARNELLRLKESANASFQEVRGFIEELRPMMLGDLGLAPTLKRYVSQFGEKSGLNTEFEKTGEIPRIESYREVLVFRGVQAILSNARSHGEATQIRVLLETDGDRIRSIVQSNGRTVATGQLELDAKVDETLGLGTLKERVTLVGGDLHVDSTPSGTRVEISIPMGPPPTISDTEYDEFA